MKDKYRIRKLWSDNVKVWAYYIECRGLLSWRRIKHKGQTYSCDSNETPITEEDDHTIYFKSDESAKDYLLKHFIENEKIVTIIRLD